MERIMSDFKSKLPDLKEIGDITTKLFKDIKTSIEEIVSTYKKNHPDVPAENQPRTKPVKAKAASEEKPAKKTKSEAEEES